MEYILNYDFFQVNSTIVADVSGNGRAGVIRNYDNGGVIISPDTVFGQKANKLILPGGTDKGFLELPNGILKNCDEFSISILFMCSECSSRSTLFSIGNDKIIATFLEPDGQNSIRCYTITSQGGLSQASFSETLILEIGKWYNLTVSLSNENDDNKVSIFLNGLLSSSFTQKRILCSDLADSTANTIGFGPSSQVSSALSIANVNFISHALSQDEVSSLFNISPAEHINFDIDAITIPDTTTVSIKLPVSGAYGSVITWKSSNEAVISCNGCVTRPSDEENDSIVTLTANYSFDNNTRAVNYTILVPHLPTKLELAKMDLDEIVIPNQNLVFENLSLPSKGKNGSIISWKSSDTSVISNTGIVSRPKNNTGCDVILKATASNLISREFRLHVVQFFDTSFEPVNIFADIKYTLEKTSPNIKGHNLRLSNVQLFGKNIFTENKNRDLDYLKNLDADRMLYNFRLAFGQDTKSSLPLGGWEEPTGLLRGHSTGHFLSALALAYASEHDLEIKEKLDYIVDELYKLQSLSKGKAHLFKTTCTPSNASQSMWSKDYSTWGEGFLSAYSPDQFALLELFTPYATIWAPYYTLHKLLAGFIDCYLLAQNQTALTVACKIADWIFDRLSATTKEQRSRMWSMYIAGEYGGMNESLATLSTITGNKQYEEAAKMFDNPKLFDGLSTNLDVISGLHANQHIPQIIGALAEFKSTGDVKYYNIAKAFWNIVVSDYAYSIGGVGRGEVLKEPKKIAINIDSDKNCETCATYNLLKLTKLLYSYAPDNVLLADYYERGLINHIAASQNPIISKDQHNAVTYMLPIGPGAQKEYSTDYEDFTCCHGTGMENHVKYQDFVFFKSEIDNTLYINLYIDAILKNDDMDDILTLHMDYQNQCANITFCKDYNDEIKLRVPWWLQGEFIIEGSGISIKTNKPSSYISLKEKFNKGDSLTIHLPFGLSVETTPDKLDGNLVGSIFYGPFVMVGLNSSTDFINLTLLPNLKECFDISWDSDSNYPQLNYFGLKFIPIFAAHNVPYHTYFNITKI